MSYVIAAPELLATAAADVASIGSSLSAANSTASASTAGVIAAAEDEVSAAIAALFSGHAQQFQALSAQAAAFHAQFMQALNSAGSAYAAAEAANASPLQALVDGAQSLAVFSPVAAATGRPLFGNGANGIAARLAAAGAAYTHAEAANTAAVSRALGALNGPTQALLGHPLIGNGESGGIGALTPMAARALAVQQTALIMGGTGTPLPDTNYQNDIFNRYIHIQFDGAIPTPLKTPEQLWPFTLLAGLGNTPKYPPPPLTFNQSVTQGVSVLGKAINMQLNLGNTVVVSGHSQSAVIATGEMRILDALPPDQRPQPGQLAFVLNADPNNPNGGLLERFTGLYIPFLDLTFSGATPPNTPYPTYIYNNQYDGFADFPQYPRDVLADLNAIAGIGAFGGGVHGHTTATPQQVSPLDHGNLLPTSPGYTGNTQYYMILTQNLPLLDPIRSIPVVGHALADLIQPDLRVLVDMGYGNIGCGQEYANIPTPASLFHLINPVTVGADLAKGAVQGSQAALVDLGLLPYDVLLPDLFSYPYYPSLDPGLSLTLGQPSVTGLSWLCGEAGSVLKLIPPPGRVLLDLTSLIPPLMPPPT